jgi:hypothetical protein
MAEERIACTTCPLCEATCGLELTMADNRIIGVRGDEADVFSRGFICRCCWTTTKPSPSRLGCVPPPVAPSPGSRRARSVP